MNSRVWLCAFAALTLGACGGGASPAEDDLAGPCVVFFDDTVLHIDEARGTNTDAVIGELRLSAFVLGGAARTAESVLDQARQNGLGAAENENVRVDGDALVCTLPCAFGTESTTWEFVADAPGYASTAQQVEARHETCMGGCPGSCRDGTRVVVFVDEDATAGI